MKSLAIWFAGFVVVFGTFAVAYHFVREGSPERVFVVVDSSFTMEAVWREVPGALDELDDERYAEFALATEKEHIHTWESGLSLPDVTPFAPCDFDEILGYQEVAEADDLVLITTAGSCDTTAFAEWRIITLGS